jgi:hypothetical protein
MQNKFVQVETLFQEGNIQQVRIGIKAKLPTPELAQLLMSLLEQLVKLDLHTILFIENIFLSNRKAHTNKRSMTCISVFNFYHYRCKS